jgi:two-component system response regulator MprA
VGLPDLDGLEVARRIRRAGSRTPIIMLTARDGLPDRIAGLDAGADDYLTKPFAYEELAARLRALGRRASAVARPDGAKLSNGPIVLDETRRSVAVSGRPVELTSREFSLLECLLRHPGHALSRDQLLDQAWPLGVAVTPNTVDAFVTFLRRKLGPDGAGRIATVRGIGYRMAEQ